MSPLPHLALAPTPVPPGMLGAHRASRLDELAALEDLELQLLAAAVGEHLPPELRARVAAVRVRRAELAALLGG